jgi:hypothetical protein
LADLVAAETTATSGAGGGMKCRAALCRSHCKVCTETSALWLCCCIICIYLARACNVFAHIKKKNIYMKCMLMGNLAI